MVSKVVRFTSTTFSSFIQSIIHHIEKHAVRIVRGFIEVVSGMTAKNTVNHCGPENRRHLPSCRRDTEPRFSRLHCIVSARLTLNRARWTFTKGKSSWRLPRYICYGEVTGKLVPVEWNKLQDPGTVTTLMWGLQMYARCLPSTNALNAHRVVNISG